MIKKTLWVMLIFTLFFLICTPLFAKGGKKIDTTPELENSVWVLQGELNYYNIQNDLQQPTNTLYVNGTVGYSFDFGLDLQLATYNCPLVGGDAQNYECDSYINATQTVMFNKMFGFVIGTQNGTVFTQSAQWHNSEFGVFSYTPFYWIELHAGAYYANRGLAATTYNSMGFTSGFGWDVYKKIRVEADYFSQHTNASGANFNLFYDKYYIGVIVPETHSGNEFAGVTGIKLKF